MANKKITALTAITALDVADVLPVADVSIPETKKITAANLWLGGFNAHKDTDGTFAANSDLVFPTQKAAKTYVDTAAAAKISDTAFGAEWNAVTTIAPSKNAVYDQMLLQMLKNGSNLAIGSDADGDMYYRASSKLARLAKGTANFKQFMNAAGTAPEWAKGIKHSSFFRDMTAESGDVAYTGYGFKPSLLVLEGFNNGQLQRMTGIYDADKSYCIYTTSAGIWTATFDVAYSYISSGNTQSAVVKSLDSDGYTLTWTKAGSPTGTLMCEVIAFR